MLALSLALLLQAPNFGAARARLEALNAREAELSSRIAANRQTQARLLSALQAARRHPPPALLISPGSAKDAVRAAILMRALEPELEHRAKALSLQAQELGRLRREAAEASSALFSAESAAADRAISGSTPAAAGRPRLATTVPVSPSPLQPLHPPTSGAVVRHYGEAWQGRGRSQGLAWRTPPGAAVVSPTDGRVEYVGPLKTWGLVVILLRADGWRAVVAGLQSAELAPGAALKAGQPLGRMPNRPAEVYLELRRGEDPVDPGPYVLSPSKAATG